MNKNLLFIAPLFTLLSYALHGQEAALRQKHYHLGRQQLALQGYDPVSYFKASPNKGKQIWNASHEGVVYWFSSAANRDLFISNPAKYEPAYGGWCAYAMSLKGEKVDVDPLTYKIVGGRLLLFYNRFFTNTLESWNTSTLPEAELLKKGDLAWKKLYRP